MAVKNMNYSKSQIYNSDDNVISMITNDNGLTYVPDTDITDDVQTAYAVHSHHVNETNSPIWNQVTYDMVETTSLGDIHVTLKGITDMGEIVTLMQHRYTAAASGKKIFDMYGSSCTNSTSGRFPAGASSPDNFKVTMPLQYENYGGVEIEASWYNSAWPYRIALQFERSAGKLRNATGHSTSEYYGVIVAVPYKANMTDGNFTDIRFTANDGVTLLDFYILNFTASGMASCIVMIPWWFIDKEREPKTLTGSATAYASTDPQWIYCYYGNAAATSTSDITLGGNTFFYDDFEDNVLDTTKWTALATTHSTITESSGLLNIDFPSTTGYTEVPVISSNTTGAKFDGTDSFEIIWDIAEIKPLSGTTANDGPIFQISDGSGSYSRCAMYYIATPTYGTAGFYWNFYSKSNGVNGAVKSTYRLHGNTSTQRFLKLSYISSSYGVGYGKIIWSVSNNGIHWDVIGRTLRLTYGTNIGGPTSGDVNINIYYNSQTTPAGPKSLHLNKILMYPIVGPEMEFVEDEFTNGYMIDQWIQAGTLNSTFTEESSGGSDVSGPPGELTLSWTSASAHNWTYTAQTCPIIYQIQKQGGLNNSEECYYQTKILAISSAVANNYAGIFLAEGITPGTHMALRYGINRDAAGVYTLRLETQSTSGVGPTVFAVTITLPCAIRIVVDHIQKKAHFDYSNDGIDWKRIRSDNGMYNTVTYQGYIKGSYMGLFALATTANSGSARFDYFKSGSGMKPSVSMIGWNQEEALADYPILPTSPGDADLTLTFPQPAHGPKRNNVIKIGTKPPGGEYQNSKIMYQTNNDLIVIGPDGTDKYIGMTLEFDMDLMSTDKFTVSGINYIYEVL